MKNLVCVIVLLAATLNLSGQTSSGCLSIGEVLNALKDQSFARPKVTNYKIFYGFNFLKFEPTLEKGKSPNDYFKVGFDSKGRCVSVEHFEKALRLSEFKMDLFEFEKFNAYSFSNRNDNYHGGMFIVPKNSLTAFMITMVPQLGEESKTHILFEGGPPVGTMNSISGIMTLDERFLPVSLIRMYEGKLVYGSIMSYDGETTYLEKEEVHIFSVPWLNGKVVPNFNAATCLEDTKDIFNACCGLVFRAEPRPYDRNVPLWVWSGMHGYE